MSFDRKFSITYGMAKKLRADGCLDLLGSEVPKSVSEALYDWDKVGRAVGILLGEEAEELLDSLEAHDIANAREALREAIISFIQATTPETVTAVEKLLDKQTKLQATANEAVVAYLEGDTLDQKVTKLANEMLSKQSAN